MEFLKDVLGEELFNQVSEKLNGNEKIRIVNAADGSYIPKAKAEEWRNDAKNLKTQVDDLNSRLTNLSKIETDANGYKAQIADLQAEMAKKETEHTRERMSYRAKDAVRAAKAKNVELVMRMIDSTKLSEKDGEITGISEQIEALKKSDGYLFEDEPGAAGGMDMNHEPGVNTLNINYEMNKAIRKMTGRQ